MNEEMDGKLAKVVFAFDNTSPMAAWNVACDLNIPLADLSEGLGGAFCLSCGRPVVFGDSGLEHSPLGDKPARTND